MARHAPAVRLATHEVANQPGEFAGTNLFTSDPALREAVLREGGAWLDPRLVKLGEVAGSPSAISDFFIATRIGQRGGRTFGALPAGIAVREVLDRYS